MFRSKLSLLLAGLLVAVLLCSFPCPRRDGGFVAFHTAPESPPGIYHIRAKAYHEAGDPLCTLFKALMSVAVLDHPVTDGPSLWGRRSSDSSHCPRRSIPHLCPLPAADLILRPWRGRLQRRSDGSAAAPGQSPRLHYAIDGQRRPSPMTVCFGLVRLHASGVRPAADRCSPSLGVPSNIRSISMIPLPRWFRRSGVPVLAAIVVGAGSPIRCSTRSDAHDRR